ncbi:MAG: ribosome maturation factor RimM [Moorea sp. SIO3C2]|nr:ribosome maturation factor RimM [Moorena sp. SIO3C2]
MGDGWLEIGRIVAPQGLNGELRVYPNTDFPERFLEPGERWLLRPNAKEPESIQLEGGRFIEGKGLYVVSLEGIRYRDQSEKLRGAKLLVPESDRPYLEEDEYHVMDLLGVAVFHHHTGDQLGTVKDIIAAGNDLLEIALLPTPDAEPAIPDALTDAQLSESTVETVAQNEGSSNVTPHASMRKKARRRMVKNAKKKKKPKIPTVLVPFVPEIVPIVDLAAGRITIDPPPGLFE